MPQFLETAMGLFSRKTRVRLQEFCESFYDRNILDASVRGVDLHSVYSGVVKRAIVEVDPQFALVDETRLNSELQLVRFEVFGLAWMHQLGDKRAAELSAFTKDYLTKRDRAKDWEAMEPYNAAIARSSTLGRTKDTGVGRAYLTFRNEILMNLFDAWVKLGFDAKVVARAANRVMTEVAWKKRMTPGFLMLALCEQLGCEVNEEAKTRLMAVICGYYDGARQALKSVKIEAS